MILDSFAGAPKMTVAELVVYLIIAGVCGAIARAMAGGNGGGFVAAVLLGLIGAFVGTWVARLFHLPSLLAISIDGRPFPIFWSILGGILLVILAHMLVRPRYFGPFPR